MTKICPMMSCRVVSIADASEKAPKTTPTVVKCQEGECAWWDSGNKMCMALALVVELIKGGGS